VSALVLLAALAAGLPEGGGPAGCAGAIARAQAMGDADLAAAATELASAAAEPGAPADAILSEALEASRAAASAGPAGGGGAGASREAGARFRAALARHCALAAEPRLPAAAEADRRRAEEILDRPAFRRARADPAVVTRWLRGLWQRILDLFESHETQRYFLFSQVLFLAAAAGAAVFGAWALLRRRPRAARALPAPAPAVGSGPDARLDAAAAAAARGDAALAVRLALLAALGALEREQALPPGRAFTNAELVALLGGLEPARGEARAEAGVDPARAKARAGPDRAEVGAGPDRSEAVRTLCQVFDRTVYGGRPAGPADAEAALAAARALGSRLGAEADR
jgi:hypothetical protein